MFNHIPAFIFLSKIDLKTYEKYTNHNPFIVIKWNCLL